MIGDYKIHTVNYPGTKLKIRYMFILGKPWFFAKDIAAVLGASDPKDFAVECNQVDDDTLRIPWDKYEESSVKVWPKLTMYGYHNTVIITADMLPYQVAYAHSIGLYGNDDADTFIRTTLWERVAAKWKLPVDKTH